MFRPLDAPPWSARVALALVLAGFLWTPLAREATSAIGGNHGAGNAAGALATVALAPWIAGSVLAVSAIAKHRGKRRLRSAYVALGVVVASVLVAVPTALHQRTMSDARYETARVVDRIDRTGALARACDARTGRLCSSAELLDERGGRALGISHGRDCRQHGAVCVSDEPDGTRFEFITGDIAGFGLLRMELTVDSAGAAKTVCRPLDHGPSQALVERVCGPDVEVAPAPPEID